MLDLYRPSLRAAGAIAVLFAWLASLGWLGMRRLHTTEETKLSSEASLRLAPGTVWYALYAGSTQVGNAGITLDTLERGYRVSETVALEIATADGLARTNRLSKTWLGTAINVQRLESRFSRAGHQAEWSVVVTDDTISAHFVSGTRRTQGRSRFNESPTASVAIPYRLALGGTLAPGRSRLIRMMDGWPLGAGLAQIKVGRDSMFQFADSSRASSTDGHWVAAHIDSVRAYSVTLNATGGPRRIWVDHHGAVSGVETPLGLRWVRTDFDLSTTEFRKTLDSRTAAIRAAEPVMIQFAATAAARDSSTETRRFVVTHRDGSPIDRELLALFAGGRQDVSGDTVTVQRDPAIATGESGRDTIPDPMIQHDAFAIAKALKGAAGGTPDRDNLAPFVAAFHALAKVDTSAGAADDALGTLGGHAGRPDGMARLFVALMRAAGMPCRYVIGVYPQGDSLFTHAWAEVWNPTSGGWYAIDAVNGMAAANTGLIRLAFGGSSHPDEMLALLANARLTEIDRKGKR